MAESKIHGDVAVGEKTVTSAGTAEALRSSQEFFKSILIIAKAGNTGQVYVGGSDVASSTNDGLDAGESVTLITEKGIDSGAVYIDVDTNGEGVDYYAVK